MYDLVLATGGYDHSIKFWDVNNGICKRSINFPDFHINKLVITPDRKMIGAAALNVVKVYEIFSHDSETVFEGITGNVTALGFQKDSKWFFTASEDGNLKIFDFKSTGYMRTISNNGVMINTGVLHPNGIEVFFGD